MKLAIVGGGPSTGKTSILCHAIRHLKKCGHRLAVAKIDCVDATSDQIYKNLGIPYVEGLSGDLCPDHFFATNFIDLFQWAKTKKSDVFIIETAGLCNRCAPFVDSATNICSIDYTTHIKAPLKFGPIVKTADVLMLSKGDLISQAERLVFRSQLKKINPKAKIIDVNGLSGQGYEKLSKCIQKGQSVDNVEGARLKYTMPAGTCSYCLGEIRLSKGFHQGVVHSIFEKGGI